MRRTPQQVRLKYIDEWQCTVPVPTRTKFPCVEFDGWVPEECNFIETKDNFDFAFDKDGNVKPFFKGGESHLSKLQNKIGYVEFHSKGNHILTGIFPSKKCIDFVLKYSSSYLKLEHIIQFNIGLNDEFKY